MDLYSALVVSTFWGFVNSICTPTFAKKSYGIIVATSKCGGILAALFGGYTIGLSGLPNHHAIPLLIFTAGLLLFACIMMISLIQKKLPQNSLQGYQSKEKPSLEKKTTGMFSGLKNIVQQPYVFGIFVLLFSVETVLIIFDYQMQLLISSEAQNNIGAMSLYTLSDTGIFHMTALLFALFGTTTLLRKIGTRLCLFIMPLFLISLTTLPLVIDLTIPIIFFIMVILRALNYGFNHPIRETLYIPTTRDIQFKSKAWIESFGKTFSKGSGSGFIFVINLYAANFVIQANSAIAFIMSCFYLVAAFFVGKKYDKTIKNNEIIGKVKE